MKPTKAELAAKIAEHRAENFELRELIEIAAAAEAAALTKLTRRELEEIASDELSD